MRSVKKIFLNLSLQKKLIIVYILAFFIPVICITTFALTRMISITNEKSFEVRQTQCRQISANIFTKLNEYYKSVHSFSNNQIIHNYFNYTYPDTSSFFSVYPSINTLLTSFRVSNPQIHDFTLYTDNPTFIKNAFTIKPLTPEIEEAYLRQKELSPYPFVVSDLEESGGSYYFTLYQQFALSPAAKYKTLFVLSYPEQNIHSLYEHESTDFSVFLTSPSQTIVSSTNRNIIGTQASAHPAINTILENNFPEGSLVSYNEKFYYVSTLSSSRLLNGWHIYMEISNEQYIQEVALLMKQALLLITAITLFGAALFFLLSHTITKRIQILVNTMSMIKKDDDLRVMIDTSAQDEIGKLAKNFQRMLNRIDRLIFDVYNKNLQVKDLEIKQKQAELLALQSQINPHFLFNTMQSLSISSYNNDDYETASYINHFCSFLRESLYWETKCVPLAKEIKVVENYLSLQKLRYDNKFTFAITIPEEFHQLLIPKFTLQPIVENAIEHGLWDCEGNTGNIRVSAYKDIHGIHIIVEDNGSGIPPEKLTEMNHSLQENSSETGSERIGIFNTNERLKLFFGPDYGLEILSILGEGTKVILHISEKGNFNDETSSIG